MYDIIIVYWPENRTYFTFTIPMYQYATIQY